MRHRRLMLRLACAVLAGRSACDRRRESVASVAAAVASGRPVVAAVPVQSGAMRGLSATAQPSRAVRPRPVVVAMARLRGRLALLQQGADVPAHLFLAGAQRVQAPVSAL